MIDVKNIRNDFPILNEKVYGRSLVYLDNAATTQKPLYVLEKVKDFYTNSNSNIHRGVHYLSEKSSAVYEDARVTVKNFIKAASTSEVIFTAGTTGGINLIADSLGKSLIKENDEVIISEMEHHSNIEPWRVLCNRNNASLKVIPFDDKGRLMVEKIPAMINDKTKFISLCHVSNVLGVVNPVKEIIQIAHRAGVPVLIDAAQSVPHLPVDVQDLDCDFLVFSGHKMYAETGIGVLYGKEKYLEMLPPAHTGGGMIKSMDITGSIYADLPFKFEAGTPNYAGAVSLAAAINYIQQIGLERIAQYEQDIIRYAVDRLSREERLILYGNTFPHCGSVSFNFEGAHPYDAAVIMDKMGVAIRSGTHCAQPVMDHFGVKGTMRLSVGLYNTHEEIDILIEGTRKAKSLLL